jgi:hypothetical protein
MGGIYGEYQLFSVLFNVHSLRQLHLSIRLIQRLEHRQLGRIGSDRTMDMAELEDPADE